MNNLKKIKIIGIIGVILLIIMVFIYVKHSNDNKDYFVGISYKELNEKIENKDSFMLCVSSTTCSHCASYKPKLKEIANDKKVEIYYTDIDQYSDSDKEKFNKEYDVSGTPTTLIFVDGREVSVMSRIEGDVSKDKVINSLEKYNLMNE